MGNPITQRIHPRIIKILEPKKLSFKGKYVARKIYGDRVALEYWETDTYPKEINSFYGFDEEEENLLLEKLLEHVPKGHALYLDFTEIYI